jgi:hypothetical protein
MNGRGAGRDLRGQESEKGKHGQDKDLPMYDQEQAQG